MPCVFKFITSQTSVDLTADGVSYATCDFNAGEEFTTFSSLSCTVNSVSVSYDKASGTVKLPFSFNVGGTGSSVDLTDSKCFTAGKIPSLLPMAIQKFLLVLIFKHLQYPPVAILQAHELFLVSIKLQVFCAATM